MFDPVARSGNMDLRQRDDPSSADDIENARQQPSMLWASFTLVEVSQKLVKTAGRFADGFALRGDDSVQLAAAHELQINAEQRVLFAGYARCLQRARVL